MVLSSKRHCYMPSTKQHDTESRKNTHGLPDTLWPLLIEASAYVRHLLLISSNRRRLSPLEKLFNAIQVDYEDDLKHIRIWGCIAYVQRHENHTEWLRRPYAVSHVAFLDAIAPLLWK
ncbi:hypothetical protein J3F83DRAFT_749449 [Trichoderma novae-zelandiae]